MGNTNEKSEPMTAGDDVEEGTGTDLETPVDERTLLNSEETLTLLDRSPVAVFLVDKTRQVYFLNDAAKEMSGLSQSEAVGQRTGDVLRCIHSTDSPEGCGFGDACQDCVIRRTIQDSYENWITHTQEEVTFVSQHAGEEEICLLVSTAPVKICGRTQVAVWLEDVTELEKARKHYQKMSRIDPLTNLPNRRHLIENLERMTVEACRYGHDVSTLMLDLDDLKYINDTFGHSVGDETLNVLADVLHATKRDADFAARTGGDEFMVALPQTGADEGRNLAERIREACEQCDSPDVCPDWTASIGVAEYEEGESIDDLRRRADEALYVSKRKGKNAVTLWNEIERGGNPH